VRLLNPDFEYLFFDDTRISEFTDEYYPQYQSVFDSFRVPIQRYDFFRYLAVHHYGGFYLDLDVFLISSLSDLLNFGCVFPFEELTIYHFLRQEYGMDWEIGNYAFGAAAKHPFIQAIIDNCIRAHRDPKWVDRMMKSIPRIFREQFYVLCTTGPGLVSRTLAEYPNSARDVKVLFPEDVCNKKNWNLFGAYGVHLRGGTWRKGPLNVWQHFIRFIRGKWFTKLLEEQLKASAKIGPKRSL